MRIHLETDREIEDDDFWDWIAEVERNGVPIDGMRLLERGEWSYTMDLGYTRATTTYRIVK